MFDIIIGFVIGAVISAIISFFVWRNNPTLMNKMYAKAKEEFDAKEKELREKLEDYKIKEKVIEAIKELKEKI